VTRGRSELLALGVHGGTPYYDCSQAFVETVGKTIAEHTDGRVSVVAPFVTWTKKDVFDFFRSADLPLALTYSCEVGSEPTCGICASCRDGKVLGC
jgi:7-cyano-7-deazaguanine synthase